MLDIFRNFALNDRNMDETVSAIDESDSKPGRVRVKNRGISDRESAIKHLISCIAWPGLMVLCMAMMAYGFTHGRPVLYFNMAYVVLIVTLFFLERSMPHERDWTKPDGQTLANIFHTLSSKGTSQLLLLFGGIIGLTQLMEDPAPGIWPRRWPMAAQVALGVVGAEFPLYWAHRVGHEWPFLGVSTPCITASPSSGSSIPVDSISWTHSTRSSRVWAFYWPWARRRRWSYGSARSPASSAC